MNKYKLDLNKVETLLDSLYQELSLPYKIIKACSTSTGSLEEELSLAIDHITILEQKMTSLVGVSKLLLTYNQSNTKKPETTLTGDLATDSSISESTKNPEDKEKDKAEEEKNQKNLILNSKEKSIQTEIQEEKKHENSENYICIQCAEQMKLIEKLENELKELKEDKVEENPSNSIDNNEIATWDVIVEKATENKEVECKENEETKVQDVEKKEGLADEKIIELEKQIKELEGKKKSESLEKTTDEYESEVKALQQVIYFITNDRDTNESLANSLKKENSKLKSNIYIAQVEKLKDKIEELNEEQEKSSFSFVSSKSKYSLRCQAITRAGHQCKRNSQAGSDYCWQH